MNSRIVRKSFQKFFPLLAGYYLIILLETAGSGILPLVFGMSVQNAFSRTTQNGIDFKGFKMLLLLLVVLGALQLCKQFIEQIHHKCASSYWISRTIEKTSRMQLGTIQAMGAGNINQRTVDEIDSITDYPTSKLSAVVSSFLLMAVAVYMLFRLLPVFTLALLFVLLLGVPIGLKLMNYGRRLLKHASEVWAKFSALTTDNAASQVQLRALGATGRMNSHIRQRLEEVLAIGLSAMLKVVALLVGFLVITLGMVYAAVLYIEHMNLFAGLSPAVVISFLGYLFLLILRAGAVSGTIGSLQGARAKIERLDEFLGMPEITGQGSGGSGDCSKLAIRGYGARLDGRMIFEHFDLDLASGEIVLIKGPSGCGKTTLLRALAGLQDSCEGTIQIGGAVVEHLGCMEGCAVYLPQETRFFEGGLLWNIELLSGRAVDTAAIDLLLRRYHLENRLQPSDGPSSCLLEAGANLSGGEKQRLALAVVELMERPVILLDEPTSQVDPISERIILDAISNLARRGSMVIMAAHREAIEDIADRVLDFSRFSRICGDSRTELMSVVCPAQENSPD